MGAWGIGTFENDDAGDWVDRLEESEGLTLLTETLAPAADPSGYLEAPTCTEALAAAEVVAALAGRPAPEPTGGGAGLGQGAPDQGVERSQGARAPGGGPGGGRFRASRALAGERRDGELVRPRPGAAGTARPLIAR